MNYNDKQHSVYNGNKLKIEIFGASHSEEIGVKVDGFGCGKIDKEKLQAFINRRKAVSTAYSTKRFEPDQVIIEEGVDGTVLNGKQFKAVIKNTSQKSSDYDKTLKIPRPSHADFVAWSKYGDGFDHRGGGKFSGRLTAPMCIAGGICKQFLEEKGIKVNAYIASIGKADGKTYKTVDVENFDFNGLSTEFPLLDENDKDKMLAEITNASSVGDSVGGIIECVVTGVPVGTGE